VLGQYRRSLEIRERLSAADPASTDLARAVFVSCMKIANLTGDRLYWERALTILRDLETRGALTAADRPLIARLEATLASPR